MQIVQDDSSFSLNIKGLNFEGRMNLNCNIIRFISDCFFFKTKFALFLFISNTVVRILRKIK